MGAVAIRFSFDQYQVENGQQSINDLFKQLIFDTKNQQHIISQLQSYHSDEDGAPMVAGFDITEVSFNPATHSGKIRFSYQVDYTFACADHRSSTRNTETSNFAFDTESHILTIFIHDKISRDTIDEF